MAKTEAKQGKPSKRAATKAFERAWKLLGRLEDRLTAARAEEARRRRQLASATGSDVGRRQAQLDDAIAAAGRAAALLTELSELIAANARAQARQTVSDVAHEAAEAVKAEEQARTAARTAAAGPTALPTALPATPRRRSPRPTGTAKAPARTAAAGTAPTRRTRKPATDAAPAQAAPESPPSPAPTRRRAATSRPAATPRPRVRRSLQPGQPDPDDAPG